jgi:hypothetical protein
MGFIMGLFTSLSEMVQSRETPGAEFEAEYGEFERIYRRGIRINLDQLKEWFVSVQHCDHSMF